MNHKIFLFFVLTIVAAAISGCGSIYYQNTTIAYPITLNEKVGIPKVTAPKSTVKHGEIAGGIGLSTSSSTNYSGVGQNQVKTTSHNISGSLNADISFLSCFQTGTEGKKRFCSNLRFEIYHYNGLGSNVIVNFKGECNEIKQDKVK